MKLIERASYFTIFISSSKTTNSFNSKFTQTINNIYLL